MISTRRRYRHLFFDLDNTIWDFNHNSWFALQETFEKHSLDPAIFESFFRVYNRHNDSLWDLYRQNGITKQELTRARFDRTLRELGIEGVDGMEINHTYLSMMPLQTHLCEGALEVLENLAQRYQMHIITNGFSEVQYSKMERSGLNLFFGRIFISEEVKSPKPEPEIFRYALKSCNARKKESLMIGDSWEVDILGAMRVGIDQVHYAPDNEAHGLTAEESEMTRASGTTTYRIARLKELLEIL